MDQSDYRKRVARRPCRDRPYEAIAPSNATGDSRPATDDDQRPRQLTMHGCSTCFVLRIRSAIVT